MTRVWRLVLPAVLGGLLAGFWIGARCERSVQRRLRREGPSPERALKKLRKELKLRDDQADAVLKVMTSRKEQFAAARREGAARVRVLREGIDKEIEPLLDADQKVKFAELRERWDKKLREGRPPDGP